MEYKKMYEAFWEKHIDAGVEFEAYSRNKALSEFFPVVKDNPIAIDIA
jgi:hypothetical protein